MDYIYYTIGLMLVSYLICGIPFGKILTKQLAHKDIQKEGSGNIGTTNALRVAGPKVAVITLAFDLLKGTVCLVSARVVIEGAVGVAGATDDIMVALAALACLYGHIFSPYLHFHGGKGIATGVGILFGYFWPLALLHLAIFIIIVAACRYVSVGSIVTAAALPLTISLILPDLPLEARIIWTVLGFTIVWAHRANIKRLLAHEESKLSFSSKKEAK